MKLLIVLMFLSSLAAYGRPFGGSIWGSSIHKFSEMTAFSGRPAEFHLRYEVLPWGELGFRRNAVSKAIATLRSLGDSAGAQPYLTDADVHPLLYSIMEHTMAIHSGLPRTSSGFTEEEYALFRFIKPAGAMPSGWSSLYDHKVEITFKQLEDSFVPKETWQLYAQWGQEIHVELVSLLESAPIARLLTDSHKREFLQMFADEFDLEKTRTVVSVSKGNQMGAGDDHYTEKYNLPVLSQFGSNDSDYRRRERWPAGFLADIKLPEPIAHELKEMRAGRQH